MLRSAAQRRVSAHARVCAGRSSSDRAADHANVVGIVQGGMIMTFSDRGLGMLALAATGGRPVVTTSFETHFVGAGRIGSFLELSGEVVRLTRSLVFLRGLVTCGRDTLAACQGSWKILSRRRLPSA